MPDTEVPLYAIVELLIRMSAFHGGLGEYQNHTVYQESVFVTTTKGLLKLAKDLIVKQASSPNLITEEQILLSAFTFRNP